MDGEAEEITRKVIEAAKAGDLTAARLVLERLVPAMKERPVMVELPEDVKSPEGISAATEAIFRAVCSGEILPGEAQSLSSVLEVRRKALETEELAQRIAALEAARK